MVKVLDSGSWETKDKSGHLHDRVLLGSLARLLGKNGVNSVVDFGCGLGDYVKGLRNYGFETTGFDGNPNTFDLSGGVANQLDLHEAFDLGQKFDAVISLEVGEHIPAEFEDVFIDNLLAHTRRMLVISWAVPGQDGIGHVNCRDNEYIRKKIEGMDMVYDAEMSMYLRRNSRLPWFKNTLMVFVR